MFLGRTQLIPVFLESFKWLQASMKFHLNKGCLFAPCAKSVTVLFPSSELRRLNSASKTWAVFFPFSTLLLTIKNWRIGVLAGNSALIYGKTGQTCFSVICRASRLQTGVDIFQQEHRNGIVTPMISLRKIPITSTSKHSEGNAQVANNANNQNWCLPIREHITTYQHDRRGSPLLMNGNIFTSSLSSKKNFLASSGKGIFAFYISLGRFLCFFSRQIWSCY